MNAAGLALAGLLAAGAAARAETTEAFYRRTPLSVYVGSGAGGGFDEIARAFAPHLAAHLPGRPAAVVKNMPGAGGLVNVNFMANAAPRDGSAIAAPFNTVFMLPLFGDPAAMFDPRRFTWLGSLDKQTGTCAVWRTSPIKTLADARARDVVVSATGLNATPAIFPSLLNTLLGTRFKIISGYSTAESRLAVERGEVEGICGLAWQTLRTTQPNWIEGNLIRVIAQMGLTRDADVPDDAPLAIDMIENPADHAVFKLVVLPQEFGRPFIAPPDLPPDRAAALTKAFGEAMADPAFLADAARIRLSLDPLSGDAVKALLDEAYRAPKDVVDRAAKFSASQ